METERRRARSAGDKYDIGALENLLVLWLVRPRGRVPHRQNRVGTSNQAEDVRYSNGITCLLYTSNFPSVQSSWVTQGPEIGQIALQFGANDLGSIMIEENVVSQAGTTYRMDVADMRRLIQDMGYEAHQRDNWYNLLN